ncbi:MAG: T9SS type A sorting domain-containing protein [Melioribacteraceae bacterium]|nr:T9SS type A sorting domain-containing protein [Melioribacteraceae bacterium]MCF8419528.1 T9SS type A sorting domain-containing protein [Melioribacteraceae bacterium]
MKMLFRYNEIDEILMQHTIGNSWVNSNKIIFEYDEEDKLLSETEYYWNNRTWECFSLKTYFYNSDDNVYQTVLQYYSGNEWTNNFRSSFEYDSELNLSSKLDQYWDSEAWINEHRLEYFYYRGKRDSILFLKWNIKEWENGFKSVFYYNDVMKIDSIVAESWIGFDWVKRIKRNYVYDSSFTQTKVIDQDWIDGMWKNTFRYIYKFNELNYIVSVNCQAWTGSDWGDQDCMLMVENPDGFKIGLITNNVSLYYTTTLTEINSSLESIPNRFRLYQNYPNPFNPTTKIKFTIPVVETTRRVVSTKLIVYDALGREVKTLINEPLAPGAYELKFDGSDLPSGIYFYSLTSGIHTQTRKMILLR